MLIPASRRRRQKPRKRGLILLECGLVYSTLLMLTLGTTVLGLGVARYQEMAWLAREGARWAAVHGPTYVAEQGGSLATSQTVMTNAITPKLVLLTSSNLTCNVTMTSGVATVSLSYNWTPEAYFGSSTLASKSVVPILY